MRARRTVDAGKLTHVDDRGRVRMVDVSAKAVTARQAAASAVVTVGPEILAELLGTTPRAGRRDCTDSNSPNAHGAHATAKGDVFATAKLAGILAAKRTSELIPLCHGLAPDHVDVQIVPQPPGALLIRAEARITARTGVEMEALVAASVAALTIYDMCKAASKAIEIGPIRLEEKTGGKSGSWRRRPKS